MEGSRGWGVQRGTPPSQPGQLAWFFPNHPMRQPGRPHGQGTSHTAGMESSTSHTAIPRSLERAGLLSRPLHAPWTPQRQRQREEQDQSKKARWTGDSRSQAMPSHRQQGTPEQQRGPSLVLSPGTSLPAVQVAAGPSLLLLPLLPHIWQQLLSQPVGGGGGWRAGPTGHLHVQPPQGRAGSHHPSRCMW